MPSKLAEGDRDSRKFPRLPMQPLIDSLELEPGTGKAEIAAVLGLDHAYFHRLCRIGLSPYIADKLAVKGAHLHPGSVWQDDWWDMRERW